MPSITGPRAMFPAADPTQLDWLVTDQQLSMHEAYTLCSVVADLKISETVDLPHWLVSMTFPRGVLR
jgi:acetamidase/formamidase